MGSIRPRILKDPPGRRRPDRPPDVAVGSIRPRILKDPSGATARRPAFRCSGLDPTEDTESTEVPQKPRLWRCCSGLDPTEDTERAAISIVSWGASKVAVGSIRPRILKEQSALPAAEPRGSCSGLDPTEDTERRERRRTPTGRSSGCSGLDPTEDTESGSDVLGAIDQGGVAVGSIRPRILKVVVSGIRKSAAVRCSGLDPTEDTERGC